MPNNLKNSQNWFQEAFNQVPKGEVSKKIDEVISGCNISLATFYNWKSKNHAPNEITKNFIIETLTQKMESHA